MGSNIIIIKINNIVNNKCIIILNVIGYNVDKNFQNQTLIRHIILFICSLVLFVFSSISVKNIGVFLFVFHMIKFLHQWFLSLFDKRNCDKEINLRKVSVKKGFSTPYHKKYYFVTLILFILTLLAILSVFRAGGLNHNVLFVIIVYLSIILNFIQDILTGLIVLYHAVPIINN